MQTIAYLTKRLKAFCEENNMPIPQATYTTFEGEAAKINKKKRKAGQGKAEDRNNAPQAGTSAAANVDSDAEINTSPPKKPRKSRPYAPRVKTGPWAILIGLASYGTGAWKTQEDIIERADPFFGEDGQSLRDKSNGGGPGSQYYTGWSSVSREDENWMFACLKCKLMVAKFDSPKRCSPKDISRRSQGTRSYIRSHTKVCSGGLR